MKLKFTFPSSEPNIIPDECHNKHVTAFCKLYLLTIAFLSPLLLHRFENNLFKMRDNMITEFLPVFAYFINKYNTIALTDCELLRIRRKCYSFYNKRFSRKVFGHRF